MVRLRFACVSLWLGLACGDDGGAGNKGSSSATDGATTSSSSSTSTSSGSNTGEPDTSGGSSSGGDDGLLDVYDLEGDTLFPEGVAFDPVGHAFFVGSLDDGSIHRITAEGEQSMFTAGPDGNWSTAGLAVDAERGRLWACSHEVDGAQVQAIWIVDLASGEVDRVVDLAEIAADAGCNDVTVDATGVAFVSDPPRGAVDRVQADGTAESWATHADFAPQAGLGLNGVAPTPDGAYLLVTKFLPATLFRIAFDDPTAIATVELSGDPFAGGSPTAGADGIIFAGDALYVAFAQHVARVDFDGDWATGSVTQIEVPGAGNGLSTAAEANGSVFVIKSEVTAWVLGQEPNLPFQILRVPGT
jgi:Cu-Zn family superoxide dismutase